MTSNNHSKYSEFATILRDIDTLQHKGKVVQAYGTTVRVSGLQVKIGQQCKIAGKEHSNTVFADVVGLVDGQAILLPLGGLIGIEQNAEVSVVAESPTMSFGDGLIGRVIDGIGNPLDMGQQLNDLKEQPIYRDAPPPLTRRPVEEIFTTGVRAIDGLLTQGVGQRTGIFAPAGGGKSTLLAMIAKYASSDVNVIALIGERGREVREFIDQILSDEGLCRSVVVVATSDRPAMERLRAAYTATSIAEGFRLKGMRVLLLMDSITRLARAQREIGLSIGEPPVRRGFPPSVFAELPKLFERAGNDDKGSITAFYTVLVEDEDGNDPIAEEVRSLLDGHITLTRKLAQESHYPAINILKSTSRLVNQITDKSHKYYINQFRKMLARYEDIEFLLQVGEYEKGHDPITDEAVLKIDKLKKYLQQEVDEYHEYEDVIKQLKNIIDE